jgi:hypothetical protein
MDKKIAWPATDESCSQSVILGTVAYQYKYMQVVLVVLGWTWRLATLPSVTKSPFDASFRLGAKGRIPRRPEEPRSDFVFTNNRRVASN